LTDQIQFPLWGCDSGCCLLLEGMKNVNRFPELCYVHRAIRSSRIVSAHLPDRFRKSVQHLRGLMSLIDLRLVQRETQPLTDDRWKARQPSERVGATASIVCQIRHKLLVENCSAYYAAVLRRCDL